MALVRAQEASSYETSGCRYHVFLSFRGKDTRRTFTDHLYTAFVNAGLQTFRDDDELERGEHIEPELQKAIQHSRSSVIVFSKDYASSKWCLDELVMILDRKKTSDHVVLPVFYDIHPSELRKQTGSFAKSFSAHQKNRSLNKDRVNGWRAALEQVADLAGMVLENEADGHEAKFVKKIVKVIEGKLSRTPLSVAPYLIGIQSRVREINLWLQEGSSNVGIFVVYGIGGIGKTTIAQVVYNSNFKRFEGSSFLENIREISEQPNGLVQVQMQLLSDIMNGRSVKIHNISEGIIKIRDVISCKKVLLVLDDVDHMRQLDAILRMQEWFYPGSKIIITTRHPGLVKAHQVVTVQNVETLTHAESLELFSWHAFGQDHPIEGYSELSDSVVSHSGGLPLALQSLGSSLSGQSIDVWESTLKKLEVIPNSDIMNKLKISYYSLQDDHDQNLFLHIACFFIGNDKDVVVTILDGCDFFTIVGIQNLIDRCLVMFDKYNKLKMHQMIRDMGREIVRLESKEPEKRSRLWHHKDSLSVLREKNGSKKIGGLALNMHIYPVDTPSRNSSIVLETDAFARMVKLRLLQLSSVRLNGSYEKFPKGLRWLNWLQFPLDSIPCDFLLESLVVLEMRYSSLRQLWKGTKSLPSLKILDLSDSGDLTETGDFSLVPNLEKLILQDCESLVDVHESIGSLEKLVYLNMKDCRNIRKLPKTISMLKSLETLILSGCSSLNEFPMEMEKMESLKVFLADEISISKLPTTLPCNLVVLNLTNCNLSNDAFPRELGKLSSLQSLDLSHNPICSLPDCIRGLTGIDHLAFGQCTRLKSLVGLPRTTELVTIHCDALEKVTFQSLSCLPENFVYGFNFKLAEIEYWYKLEPIGSVDVEMINILGLCNLETMDAIKMYTPDRISSGAGTMHPVQGLHEYGIFSTFLPGNNVPGQFSHRGEGSSVSFIVPSLPILRGLNIFAVYRELLVGYVSFTIPNALIIRVTNKSKGLKWIYAPSCYGVPDDQQEVIWLSHWKCGNQLEGGDEVTVAVFTKPSFKVKECGIQVVHEQEDDMSTQRKTPDPCYPFPLGRDLSEYVPGTYFLGGGPFLKLTRDIILDWTKEAWFSGDSDDEETDKEEMQHADELPALAEAGETSAEAEETNNNRGHRSSKIFIVTAVFFLFLSLISLPLCSFLSKYFI